MKISMTSGEYVAASFLPEVVEPDEESDMDVAVTLAALARIKLVIRLPDDLVVTSLYEGFPLTVKLNQLKLAMPDSSL